MALGKRKRQTAVVGRLPKEVDDDHDDGNDVGSDFAANATVFQKYFEAQFEPLPVSEKESPPALLGQDRSEDGTTLDRGSDEHDLNLDLDWNGLSDDDDDHGCEAVEVEVIEHTFSAAEEDGGAVVDKAALKSFMVWYCTVYPTSYVFFFLERF